MIITLTRFLSEEEFQALMSGKTIYNYTDHYNSGYGGSTSRGFCFTTDPPDVAWKYLKGIVSPDRCIIIEIDRKHVLASRGKYADQEGPIPFRSIIKREFCATSYSLKVARIKKIVDIHDFAPQYEIDAINYFIKIKNNLINKHGRIENT